MPQYKEANEKRKRAVKQIDVLTGKEICFYESIRDAERETGIKSSNIVSALKKRCEQAGGYRWCYVERSESDGS